MSGAGTGAGGQAVLARGRLNEHEAALEGVDGERALIACSAPLPPGKPATLTLALEPPLTLALKTVGSKRRPDGSFEVSARIVMLSRSERDRLGALVASVASATR